VKKISKQRYKINLLFALHNKRLLENLINHFPCCFFLEYYEILWYQDLRRNTRKRSNATRLLDASSTHDELRYQENNKFYQSEAMKP